MKKYGIENVRGGSFCKIKLTEQNKNTIKHMILGSSDSCYNCGKSGHFASNCKKKSNNKKYEDSEEEFSDEDCDEKSYENFYKYFCEYCNREFTTEKGCLFHENVHCKKKLNNKKYQEDSEEEESSEEEIELEEYHVYNVDGETLLWMNGEWYEESQNNVGHRDGTVGVGGPNMKGWGGDWRPIKKTKRSSKKKCYRCGRQGHDKSSCYASTHIKGYGI